MTCIKIFRIGTKGKILDFFYTTHVIIYSAEYINSKHNTYLRLGSTKFRRKIQQAREKSKTLDEKRVRETHTHVHLYINIQPHAPREHHVGVYNAHKHGTSALASQQYT